MRIVITGGGTGGHLFPGLALAEEFSQDELLFLGARKGLEAKMVPEHGYAFEGMNISGLRGVNALSTARNLTKIPIAVAKAAALLRCFNPDIVIGVGGYSSGPTVLAAVLQRRWTAILEQNSIPGFTNRFLGRMVNAVFITFPGSATYFPRAKVHHFGNPIRRSIIESEQKPRVNKPFTVLVLGGSQGAQRINEVLCEALPSLKGEKLHIIHQTGKADHSKVQAAYEKQGVSADIRTFIQNMASAYGEADLIISRAGATTIAEITACGRASVLIPFPHAVDDHQRHNALALSRVRAAILLPQSELTADKLVKTIMQLKDDPEGRQQMEETAKALSRPDAGINIAKACRKLSIKKRHKGDHTRREVNS